MCVALFQRLVTVFVGKMRQRFAKKLRFSVIQVYALRDCDSLSIVCVTVIFVCRFFLPANCVQFVEEYASLLPLSLVNGSVCL
jgi:hypothetical protein